MSSHWVKSVLRAWGELKRGFELLALGKMCFEGMGTIEKGEKDVLHLCPRYFDVILQVL